MPMLQVLRNTSGEVDSLNANARVISEFFIYACLNNSIMVKCGWEKRERFNIRTDAGISRNIQ